MQYVRRRENHGLNSMIGETMVPEGLEHKSVEDILDDIVSVGFNFIRM